MAVLRTLPPRAGSLFSSMRDLGYSLETAVADIVDNSISAGATSVDIVCDTSGESLMLAILDNGHGMNEGELLEAMRYGTKDRDAERSKADLGRFGLGLKTASFSQCRQLTVISSQKGKLCGAEWDLEEVRARDEWIVSVLESSEIDKVPFVGLLGKTGTLVLWRKLDRLFANVEKGKRDELTVESLSVLENHLSLVFHRFIAGEFGKAVAMSINGHTIQAFDPFCRKVSQWVVENEKVVLNGERILINAYILPHFSRLSAREEAYYKSRNDFLSNQGAYVYRNGRLMAWGDWFRLVPKGESTKLARVQIDFPSTLDSLWTIDIKKSSARPPELVRQKLKQILPEITEGSKRVFKGRGRRSFGDTQTHMWERFEDRDGIRYAVNRDHPLVTAFKSKLSNKQNKLLDALLDMLACTIPVESIYADYATNPRQVGTSAISKEELLEKLRIIHALVMANSSDREKFLEMVEAFPLFKDKMPVVKKFLREEMS